MNFRKLSLFQTQKEFDDFSSVVEAAAKQTVMLADPHTGHKRLAKLANVKEVAAATGVPEKQIRIWIKKKLIDECFGLTKTILGSIHSSYFQNKNPWQ